MPLLNLGKTYKLTRENVNKLAKEDIGNYALGFFQKRPIKDKDKKSIQKTFFPHYVGSSFTNLKAEIIQQGFRLKTKDNKDVLEPKYTHFKFSHVHNTPIRAFRKESQNYHDFKSKLENQRHPKRPEGKTPVNLPCHIKGCIS